MTTEPTKAALAVTDVDREAAAELLWPLTHGDVAAAREWKAMLDGEADSHPWVRAFAARRIAALEEAANEAERFYQAYPRETKCDVTAWEIAAAIRNLKGQA